MRYVCDSSGKKRVTLIPGDGIGPEVIAATCSIVDAAGANVAWESHLAGAEVFRSGLTSGVPQATADSIAATKVVLKGPLETPVGFGAKSANVTLRKMFEMYSNIRPVRELPNVKTRYSGEGVDMLIVRENVEDLYAGIEHMQTPGVAQCLKIMSRKGCEKIVRFAFEAARAERRTKVHCATKANIMKFTEGLMKQTFEEIAVEYPEIEAHHIIVDNCAHQLVINPAQFDVIVTSNMNGDILSDLASGLIGGLGFAPGANLGNHVAMFEAVHGSAPSIAGRDLANPTAVLLSAVMMLRHLDELAAAQRVERGLMTTLEQGIYTCDVRATGSVGTRAFAQAVIKNLDAKSMQSVIREHRSMIMPQVASEPDMVKPKQRRVVGVDVFIESAATRDEIGHALDALVASSPLRLKMISNRGTKVYPNAGSLTDCVDQWRCRFIMRNSEQALEDAALLALLTSIPSVFSWMHVEKLQEFDGKLGYSLAQGEN
jgi:isocitrate dehydrogenase